MKNVVYVVVNKEAETIVTVTSNREDAMTAAYIQQEYNGVDPEAISVTPVKVDANYCRGLAMCYNDDEVSEAEDIIEKWYDDDEEYEYYDDDDEDEEIEEYADWREEEEEEEEELPSADEVLEMIMQFFSGQ